MCEAAVKREVSTVNLPHTKKNLLFTRNHSACQMNWIKIELDLWHKIDKIFN